MPTIAIVSQKGGSGQTTLAVNLAAAAEAGFYTLAPVSIDLHQVHAPLARGLPLHDVGGYLLARIATSIGMHGKGLGGQLLLAAGK